MRTKRVIKPSKWPLILMCLAIILTNSTTFYVTKLSVKPERVMVIQEKVIYKLQNQIEIQKIKEQEEFLLRIPFTDIGITKQFTLGTGFGFILYSLI